MLRDLPADGAAQEQRVAVAPLPGGGLVAQVGEVAVGGNARGFGERRGVAAARLPARMNARHTVAPAAILEADARRCN